MKILITGICGFAGSSIAEAWLEAETGLEIFGMDNFIRPGSESNRNRLGELGITLFHGDTRIASDFDTLPAVDWVIDAAANPSVLAGIDGLSSSRQLVEHNLVGTINILEYCKRNRSGFILLSTSRVYSIRPLSKAVVETAGDAFRLKPGQLLPSGLSQSGVSELFSTEPPISLYGMTKLASEGLALEYENAFGFPVWINRCGLLAGAGQFGRPDQGIFAYWINSWLRRRPLKYIGFGGEGHQVRDGLHPRDLVPLLRQQVRAEQAVSTKIVNLGGGQSNALSLAELSRWCSDRLGAHQVGSDPNDRPYDVPWLIMDSALAKEEWGWQPQTPVEAILEEIAEHAEQNPNWLTISGLS